MTFHTQGAARQALEMLLASAPYKLAVQSWTDAKPVFEAALAARETVYYYQRKLNKCKDAPESENHQQLTVKLTSARAVFDKMQMPFDSAQRHRRAFLKFEKQRAALQENLLELGIKE